MSKTLTALLTTTALTAGCVTTGPSSRAGDYKDSRDFLPVSTTQSRLATKPSYKMPTVSLTSPNNAKGIGVQEYSPQRHSEWDLVTMAQYGKLYEIVKSSSVEGTNAEIILRPLLASNLVTDGKEGQKRLTGNVFYTAKRLEKGGRPVNELPFSTKGPNAVKAEIRTPNLEGVTLGSWKMNQKDVRYDLKLVELKRLGKDDRIATENRAAPLISEETLEAYNTQFKQFLAGEGEAPRTLPFVWSGPLAWPPSDKVNMNTGQVTLTSIEVFYFELNPNVKPHESGTGSLSVEVGDVLDASLSTKTVEEGPPAPRN